MEHPAAPAAPRRSAVRRDILIDGQQQPVKPGIRQQRLVQGKPSFMPNLRNGQDRTE
jgi:hypothetical protein